MINEKDRIDPSEVQGALDSIQEMERAALWRAIPPRWFAATVSLLAGALVTLSAADLREYHVFIILLLALVMLYQAQKTGVSVREFPPKLAFIAVIILVPLFFLLVVVAQALRDMFGFAWAPLSAGVVLATTVYILSIFERRWYFTKIGVAKGE